MSEDGALCVDVCVCMYIQTQGYIYNALYECGALTPRGVVMFLLCTVVFMLLHWTYAEACQLGECRDWGSSGVRRVFSGEAAVIHCPTLSQLDSNKAAELSVQWYRYAGHGDGSHTQCQRVSAGGQHLWFQPASAEHMDKYICVLRHARNSTYCAWMDVQLTVVERPGNACVQEAPEHHPLVYIPLEESRNLTCPDLQDFHHLSRSLKVEWFHNCYLGLKWGGDREMAGEKLTINLMRDNYGGNYTCVATYMYGEKTMRVTRVIAVKPVSSSRLPKDPIIHRPDKTKIMVKTGTDVHLTCVVYLPFLEEVQPEREVWWEVNGVSLEKLATPRITNKSRLVQERLGNRDFESVLKIQQFSSEDLKKEYTCFAKNSRSQVSRKALLQVEDYLPNVELGCGLGVSLFLILSIFVLYHMFKLEILLLYRAHFGMDERSTDGKEYDVYISYARNSQEEQFVLVTLRPVLENQLGYRVCIFDRDSLPGGTITDETLSFVGRSRRLIVVLSPVYALQGTQALLELKAGLDNMMLAGDLRVILVQYQPVNKKSWVKELRRARVALAHICWKGDKSVDISSRFWKQLQLELPMRRSKDTKNNTRCTRPLYTA